LLGLLRCQQGHVRLFGQSLQDNPARILRRIGSSIEGPSLYSHLSAAENLEVWRKVFDCSERRVIEVLHQVGLADCGSRPAGQFSMGMKQRLGLAVALLHQPDLLVLDEPTNGLDPHGIVEMREFLNALNRDHGTTILVSSHLLSEVEQLVTQVGIINKGTMRFQGSISDLAGQGVTAHPYVVRCSDPPQALILARQEGIPSMIENDWVRVECSSRRDIAGLNARLVASGIEVHELTPLKRGLEQIYFDLVRGEG